MSSQLSSPAPSRSAGAPLHKVVTRHNGLLFHCITVASFMESTAPLHANALVAAFAAEAGVRGWLNEDWSPGKAATGRRLRAYVEETWAGFDWACAYDEFYEGYRPRVVHAYAQRCSAHVALSLCATAAQTAAFYRGLAAYADDPELRQLLREAAGEEACRFDHFRALFERVDQVRPLGMLESYRAILRAGTDARDGAVRLAFSHIARNWCERAPFPDMDYSLFIRRTCCALERHLAPGIVERALFRPWLKSPKAPLVEMKLPSRSDRSARMPQLVAAA